MSVGYTTTRTLRRPPQPVSYAEKDESDESLDSVMSYDNDFRAPGLAYSAQILSSSESNGSPSAEMGPSGPLENESERPRKRVRLACDFCRGKKCRCTGTMPCDECVKFDQICHYTVNNEEEKDRTYSQREYEAVDQAREELLWSLREMFLRMKQHVVEQGGPEEFTRVIPWLKESPLGDAPPGQVINPQASVRLKKRPPRVKSRRPPWSQRRSQHGGDYHERLSSPEVPSETSDHLQDLAPLHSSTTVGTAVQSDEANPIHHDTSVAINAPFADSMPPRPPTISSHPFDFSVGPSQNIFTPGPDISVYPNIPRVSDEYGDLNVGPSSFSQNQSYASVWPQPWPQNYGADPATDKDRISLEEFNSNRLYASTNYDANDLYRHQQ